MTGELESEGKGVFLNKASRQWIASTSSFLAAAYVDEVPRFVEVARSAIFRSFYPLTRNSAASVKVWTRRIG
ncbi:MAG: hypothetical protein WAO83_21430 [Fuerstiella sp.]